MSLSAISVVGRQRHQALRRGLGLAALQTSRANAAAGGQAAQARAKSIADILSAATRKPGGTSTLDGSGRQGRLASTAAITSASARYMDDVPLGATHAWSWAPAHRTVDSRRPASGIESYAKPTLSDPNRCWIYSPAALEKAPVEPRRGSGAVRFQMWKINGYLHVQAACMPCPLVLPVFTSDGIGYPALSSVLRAWKDAGNTRWQLFRHYMAAALDGEGVGVPPGKDCPPPISDAEPKETDGSKRLDKRFGQERCSKEWLFVCQLDGRGGLEPSRGPTR